MERICCDTLADEAFDGFDNFQVRSMAAVLLRRLYTSNFEEFWPQFTPEQQVQLKEQMLLSIQQEPNSTVRKKICECAAEFARNLLGKQTFVCKSALGFNISYASAR